MAYSSGILRYRVTILNKVRPTQGEFGATTGYEPAMTVNANVTFNKGTKALREGALDAYDVVIFRMRYNSVVTRDSRLKWHDKTYQILSLNNDFQDNTIQITATELVK